MKRARCITYKGEEKQGEEARDERAVVKTQ